MRFYGEQVDAPLSVVHNTPGWGRSDIGRLTKLTKGAIYVRELPRFSLGAEFCWRVTGAGFSMEDGVITYFKAYDREGKYQPGAKFGVHWDGVESRIAGGFEYKPEFGNHYYVPVENRFVTPESGGYTVQVLDMKYPSEGLAFGMYKQDKLHQCLVVSFRLFPLGADYPQDVEESRQ